MLKKFLQSQQFWILIELGKMVVKRYLILLLLLFARVQCHDRLSMLSSTKAAFLKLLQGKVWTPRYIKILLNRIGNF